MAEKEGGVVKKGHEEGLKLAASLLQEFELPEGLLPLADVIEVGYVKGTGYMWIVQKKKVEHEFKLISKLVSYDTEIKGYISKKKIKKWMMDRDTLGCSGWRCSKNLGKLASGDYLTFGASNSHASLC